MRGGRAPFSIDLSRITLLNGDGQQAETVVSGPMHLHFVPYNPFHGAWFKYR